MLFVATTLSETQVDISRCGRYVYIFIHTYISGICLHTRNPTVNTYVVSHFVASTCCAPKNMLYKLFKLFTQVHNKEQTRESSISLSSLLGGHIGSLLPAPPTSIYCFPLHNLCRLIMFRQNDKRHTQTCGSR